MDKAQRVEKAVDQAKKLVKQGNPWGLAIHISARDHQVRPADVSRAFAARRRQLANLAPAGVR